MNPKTRQEILESIQEYRLIDDTFMTAVFRDKTCTQLLIRYILQRDDLEVLEVFTQNELKNLRGRSVRLDILATDRAGAFYNIEVQRADKGASEKEHGTTAVCSIPTSPYLVMSMMRWQRPM